MAETAGGRFFRLEMEGLAELQKSMQRAGAQAAEMAKANQTIVDVIAGDAKREVPVRSGKLRASIRGQATRSTALLVTGSASVPYAGPIHFGWVTRGLGRDKKKDELISALGSRSRSRRHGTGGAFSDKTLRRAVSQQNRTARAKKGKVRGGPIRPNPFLYRALDHRFDDVVAAYDKHADSIAQAVNEGKL